MTTARHVIFGTGAIGLATLDALRRLGEIVRLVNRSGHAPVSDDVEVVGGDARDPAFTTAVAQGASVVYQTLNPPSTTRSGVPRRPVRPSTTAPTSCSAPAATPATAR